MELAQRRGDAERGVCRAKGAKGKPERRQIGTTGTMSLRERASPDICSFSPLGESTPGSIYLWDGRDRMAVVRVYGRTGKVRTLYYRRGERGWTR